MTDEELTIAAVNRAYEAQVGKIFAVLCAAPAADVESGIAVGRFKAGLERARTLREEALKAAQ